MAKNYYIGWKQIFQLCLLVFYVIADGQTVAETLATTTASSSGQEGNLDSDFNSANTKLVTDLLKRHSKKLRPVRHPNDTLVVHLLAALYQIVDVDQRTNLVDISAYFDLWWDDQYLRWNPEQYENIWEIYLPADEVWTPDLYLSHSVQGTSPMNVHHSAVRVYSSGRVRVFLPFTAKAFCPINVKYFPFEELSCWFNFGSWSYKKELMTYEVAESNVSLNDFYDNQEWVLKWAKLSNNQSEYNNSYFYEEYSTVTLEILLERGSFYYIFNLIIPSTMVTIVSIIGFHAAANSTERRESKFRLGIMTLLSMGVLLLNVVDNMPKFSMVSQPGRRGSFSDVPLLGLYYLSLLCLVSLSTCTSSVFVTLETYALHHPVPIPACLKWLAFDWPFGKKSKKGDYTPIEVKSHQSPELLSNEIQSLSQVPSHPPPNHSQQTQLDQTYFAGALPPPLKSQKQRKVPVSEDFQLMSKSLERLCDTCQNVLFEVKQIRSSIDLKKTPPNEGRTKQPKPLQTSLLTPQWNRIICRIERISLFIYLSLIVISLAMFFHKEWY